MGGSIVMLISSPFSFSSRYWTRHDISLGSCSGSVFCSLVQGDGSCCSLRQKNETLNINERMLIIIIHQTNTTYAKCIPVRETKDFGRKPTVALFIYEEPWSHFAFFLNKLTDLTQTPHKCFHLLRSSLDLTH
jgi:hypothetical protein